MAPDANTTASKRDIALLVGQIGAYSQRTDRQLAALEEALDAKLQHWQERTVHEFRVVAEDIRHDFQGAFRDRLAALEDRIRRLEQHAGLPAA